MKNRFNVIVLNICIADFLISSIGIFMDNIGSSLGGRQLEKGFCQFEGFFYMTTGYKEYNNLDNIEVLNILIETFCHSNAIYNVNLYHVNRHGIFISDSYTFRHSTINHQEKRQFMVKTMFFFT